MLEIVKKCSNATTFVILATLLSALPVCFSQARRGDVIANIPFPFAVADHVLPPGRYTITPVGEINLRIYSPNRQGVVVSTHSVVGRAPEGMGKLIFHHCGDTYFLSAVWVAANGTGRQLFPSKAEKEAAMRNGVETAEVRIAP